MGLDTLCSGKYVSLTTFRADGTPVATPVWLVRDGDRVVIITKTNSAKVTRIRSNARVMLAPCDARGRVTGEAAAGTATLLDDVGTRRVASLIEHQYGLMGRVLQWFSDRRSGDSGDMHIGIAVTVDPEAAP